MEKGKIPKKPEVAISTFYTSGPNEPSESRPKNTCSICFLSHNGVNITIDGHDEYHNECLDIEFIDMTQEESVIDLW